MPDVMCATHRLRLPCQICPPAFEEAEPVPEIGWVGTCIDNPTFKATALIVYNGRFAFIDTEYDQLEWDLIDMFTWEPPPAVSVTSPYSADYLAELEASEPKPAEEFIASVRERAALRWEREMDD